MYLCWQFEELTHSACQFRDYNQTTATAGALRTVTPATIVDIYCLHTCALMQKISCETLFLPLFCLLSGD